MSQARRISGSGSSEEDEEDSEPHTRTTSARQQQYPRPAQTTRTNTRDNYTSSPPSDQALPSLDEPEEAPPPPKLMCLDGKSRVLTAAVWEPLRNIKSTDDITLVKSYMSNRIKQFGTLTGRKRVRADYEGALDGRTSDDVVSDNNSLGPVNIRNLMVAEGEENEEQGGGGTAMIPYNQNEDIDTESVVELLFSEVDVHDAVINDPFNLVLTGNVGRREIIPMDTPLGRAHNLLVSSNSDTPEAIYCKRIAETFNKEVLTPYNRSVLQKNIEYIQKIETGILSTDDPVKYVSLDDGTRAKIDLDPVTGKIPQNMIKSILREGLGLPWTSEQVRARRQCNLNPHLDMENMAKRYKIMGEMIGNEDILFINTEECYKDGRVIRKLNERAFRCMVKCDEMYQRIIGWNGLSIFANRTTAMNLGHRTFSGLTLDTDTQEIVREVTQHLGHRNAPSNAASARKLISKQSLSHNGATSQIGETSQTGRKMSSITQNTSNAQKRRRLGLPAGKDGGYHHGGDYGNESSSSSSQNPSGGIVSNSQKVRPMDQFV